MGALNLMYVLANEPPKFFVGLSSIIGVTGMAGNAWYGFSNESLDVITALQNKASDLRISAAVLNKLISRRNGKYFAIRPDAAHKHNYVNEDGNVFQDIWVPGISGVVNQGTQNQ